MPGAKMEILAQSDWYKIPVRSEGPADIEWRHSLLRKIG
jgi:hypothetical protein